MVQFDRTIGIDYSGAKTSDSSLPGLRLFVTEGDDEAYEVCPPPSRKKYWTRRALAEWLKAELQESVPTIVGIDHAFSFPQPYFEKHNLPYCWDCFLKDFCRHWPTSNVGVSPHKLRKSGDPKVEARCGTNKMFRRTEMYGTAKSVFQFGVEGEVASSTHAGLPFLRELRHAMKNVHFWPFDGWKIPAGMSCIAEAYPTLYRKEYEKDSSLKGHQLDAYATAMWMRDADRDGRLKDALNPALPDRVRTVAQYEGWILGTTWQDD